MSNQSETGRTRLLIYAAVPDEAMLEQGFYAAEADGLRACPYVADVRLTNKLAMVAQGDYDGLISFFYSHSAVAALLARVRGKPVVVTGGGEQLFPELAGSRLRYLARSGAFRVTALLASKILATSTSDLDRMRRTTWLTRSKLDLSFHGASAIDRTAGINTLPTRSEGSFVTICGLDTPLNLRRKGIPEALALLERARLECPSAYLTIIGRSTCRGIVEEEARVRGVADGVVFAGYVSEDEKISLLRSHRYYLQLSVYEGFGIGALEALSQGCQVIHSGVGGLVDTIADFGVVVPHGGTDTFSLRDLPPYDGIEAPSLARHLKHFQPETRAMAIYRALFGNPATRTVAQ